MDTLHGRLEGVWASPPGIFIMGRSPRSTTLLGPENERPVCFPVGHREYDPVKLGYVSGFQQSARGRTLSFTSCTTPGLRATAIKATSLRY